LPGLIEGVAAIFTFGVVRAGSRMASRDDRISGISAEKYCCLESVLL
jgi:formylmethanofuran:tetrahydromethanopterin formyltransferase